MFKKPHQLKPAAPLRSSDRRKLVSEVQDKFPGDISSEKLELILPKSLLSGKFSTHIGENGVLYSNDKNPTFFRIKEFLVPTVYTLWELPFLLPKIHTNEFVMSKLFNGADLMIPGIFIPDNSPALLKNQLVAICLDRDETGTCALCVGYLACDLSKVKPGDKGRGVYVLHTFKDHLWQQGSKTFPKDSDIEGLEAEPEEKTDGPSKPEEENVTLSNLTISEPEQAPISTEEVDNIFIQALYQGLTVSLTSGKSKSILPLLASTFYSGHVLPNRAIEVDLKNSSWKKLAKFLKEMEKCGIFTLKDIKGATHIKSINYDYPGLKEYRPFKVRKSATKSSEQASNNAISVHLLYKVTEPLKPLFPQSELKRPFTSQEVKDILNNYFASEELVNKRNARNIQINPLLCDIFLKKHEVFAVDFLHRDEFYSRTFEMMKKCHRVEVPGLEPSVHDGLPEPIKFIIEKRMGNKLVTKVHNLELYGFDPEELSKELQVLCASSVSVSAIPGRKVSGRFLNEIVVQGPQQKNLTTFFQTKGMPANLIEVINKANTKKK